MIHHTHTEEVVKSKLIVVGFDTVEKAYAVRHKLSIMQKEHFIELEDSALLIKSYDGECRVKQSRSLTFVGACGGGVLGLCLGLFLLQPLAGLLVGAAAGGITGKLAHSGIDDESIKKLGSTLKCDTSAIFILFRGARLDKVLDLIATHSGTILKTSMSPRDEGEFKGALDRAVYRVRSRQRS